jgi:hypothetical protein
METINIGSYRLALATLRMRGVVSASTTTTRWKRTALSSAQDLQLPQVCCQCLEVNESGPYGHVYRAGVIGFRRRRIRPTRTGMGGPPLRKRFNIPTVIFEKTHGNETWVCASHLKVLFYNAVQNLKPQVRQKKEKQCCDTGQHGGGQEVCELPGTEGQVRQDREASIALRGSARDSPSTAVAAQRTGAYSIMYITSQYQTVTCVMFRGADTRHDQIYVLQCLISSLIPTDSATRK